MKSALQTSSVHVVSHSVEETHFKRAEAFSDLKKTLKANAFSEKRVVLESADQCKRRHKKKMVGPLKRPPNGYMMFSKENAERLKKQLAENKESSQLTDVDRKLSKLWKRMPTEQKLAFKAK